MSNILQLGGVLLFFATCLAQPQNPNIVVQPGGGSSSNVLSLNINTKKCIHTVSDHFLSITLEPSTILLALQKNLGSTVINMAKGLRPAYIRISGPECNYFKFQGGQDTSQLSPTHPIKHGRNNITITGWHWSQLNEFIIKTGLDLIVGLNIMSRQQGAWDLSNAVDLISFSDKHSYNMAFQLGNDFQTIGSRIDGLSLGKDATRLRKVLEAFPRYMNSVIISPDVKSCETQEEARNLKNFIVESGSSLSALTYQAPFSSEKSIENPTAMFSYIQNQLEARVWQKDLLNKYLGKTPVKKPLWIVESGNKDRRYDFMDGLNWAQRLCAGARVGINAILRKPSLTSLSEPTPDYWVSVLHKALIGSEVLDIKISSGNKTRLETVAHCTKVSSYDPNEGILAPEYRYIRGAITVFGVNMGSENVKISLKTGQKQSLPIHQYFLTSNSRQNGKGATRSLSTLLNGQKLILSSDGELPIISPKVKGSHQSITIPSQCVFFLVLPDSQSKACSVVQIDELKDSNKSGVRIGDQDENDETDYDTPILDQEEESVLNEKNIYVAFRPKYLKPNEDTVVQSNERLEDSKSNHNVMPEQNNEESHNIVNLHQPEPVVKYVTFSNNNWLSKFPKTLNNNQAYSVEPTTVSPTEATTMEIQTEKYVSPAQSRREKYLLLAQAVAGKRYPEKSIRTDDYSNLDSHRSSHKLKLIKRSIGNDINSKDMIEEFTNKEEHPLDTLLKVNKSSSVVSLKLNEDHTIFPEHLKKEVTTINPKISEVQKLTSQSTQQIMTTSTPTISTVATDKKQVKTESRIQKIKTRAEQALAKATERAKKINERRLHEKVKEVINPNTPRLITDKSVTTNTEISIPKKESKTIEDINNLAEKFRYNRQANNTRTDINLKPIGSHMNFKSNKYDTNVSAENENAANIPVAEKTNHPPNNTEISSSKTTKLRNITYSPRTLRITKPKVLVNVTELKTRKSIIKESRESAKQPALKLKVKPVVDHLALGKVKTSPNVDVDQIITNEKITEKLVENLRDGKKTLQSEHIVSPIAKNEETKLETKTSLTANTKMKALEEKIKIRRSEMERRLQERFHKVNKRSPSNDIIEDDILDINNILHTKRFVSNELNVDVGPVLKREANRYPRAVADFTVKLNEVNTFVDKNRRATDPKYNEITAKEDNDDASLKDWKTLNDIHLSAKDGDIDNINLKSKRKSIFGEIDEDDYSKTTIHMINKLFSHMQKLWKYIKKTFLL